MYKIEYKDNVKDTIFIEYCFTRKMAKRIYFLVNEQLEDFSCRYEILNIYKLVNNFKCFKKCFKNEIIIK